ncbi:MAG TPA: hypothetical protein PLK41_08745 [Defluviitoga tunisiensis]|nr:hypothetical protein [Defluviitoga tunisiensis]
MPPYFILLSRFPTYTPGLLIFFTTTAPAAIKEFLPTYVPPVDIAHGSM